MTAYRARIIGRIVLVAAAMAPLLAGSMVAGVLWGSSGLGPGEAWEALAGTGPATDAARTIVLGLRLPNVLLAALAGAALSLGGLAFQALLRNPLAEPYILGLSGGAGVGAVLGRMAGLAVFPWAGGCAFTGGLGAAALLFFLNRRPSMSRRGALLLSGVMINAFCGAFILLLLSMSRVRTLHGAVFWLMGDLSSASIGQVGWLALFLAPCFLGVFLLSKAMNLFLLGEEAAASLGLDARGAALALVGIVSLMAGAVVGFCGLLGFVGLVVPHAMRLLLGSDHRVLVPACILGGGAYLVLCDLAARLAPMEGKLPVGVVTALVGAPAFIAFMRRREP